MTMTTNYDISSSSDEGNFTMRLMNEDSDDDETEEKQALALLLVSSRKIRNIKRRENCNQLVGLYVKEWLQLDQHITELLDELQTAFSRFCCMEHSSFKKLLSMIFPIILNSLQTGNSYNRWLVKRNITIEIVLHCLLCWLEGGSYLDIRLTAGISVPWFYMY